MRSSTPLRAAKRPLLVEPRIVPLEPGKYRLTAEHLDKYVDENTICVVAIARQRQRHYALARATMANRLRRIESPPHVPIQLG